MRMLLKSTGSSLPVRSGLPCLRTQYGRVPATLVGRAQTGRRQTRTEASRSDAMTLTDDQAIQRYRYMLATAPPEEIERAHEEAFAKLTPDQRRQALQALAQYVPPSELHGDDAASLARTATRAEVRQPGTIERAWGAGGTG